MSRKASTSPVTRSSRRPHLTVAAAARTLHFWMHCSDSDPAPCLAARGLSFITDWQLQ